VDLNFILFIGMFYFVYGFMHVSFGPTKLGFGLLVKVGVL